jgi:hypothetical protein
VPTLDFAGKKHGDMPEHIDSTGVLLKEPE